MAATQAAALRLPEIRAALARAHVVAAVNVHRPEAARRELPAAACIDGGSPMDALRVYLGAQGVERERERALLAAAGELLAAAGDA